MTEQSTLERPTLDDLTAKQREVLEHLACHKTSKQIARDLDVAQNTVDKHLTAVRRKWGTMDRYQTVRVFQELRGGLENHPPRISAGDEPAFMPPSFDPDLPKSAVFRLQDVLTSEGFADWDAPAPKGLQALDRRFGKLWRIAAIPLLALLMGMVLVWALSFARTLSELF